jgi:hypothetical protein
MKEKERDRAAKGESVQRRAPGAKDKKKSAPIKEGLERRRRTKAERVTGWGGRRTLTKAQKTRQAEREKERQRQEKINKEWRQEKLARIEKEETGAARPYRNPSADIPEDRAAHSPHLSARENRGLDVVRDFYKRTYSESGGLAKTGSVMDALQEQMGGSREEAKKALLKMKNAGALRLAKTFEKGNLREEDIIRDGTKMYYAVQIPNIMDKKMGY